MVKSIDIDNNLVYNYKVKCEPFANRKVNMKKIYLLFIFLALGLSACNNLKEADIVTTMFVQYDIASEIVKDKMSVSMIIAAGAEVHGYEPSSRDIEAIKNSKLFIYTSLEIDDWIKDPSSLKGETTIMMDLSKSYHYEGKHYHENNLVTNDDDHNHDDLHYWTDPVIFMELINSVLNEIIKIDPENEEFYRINAKRYYDEIDDLHHELEDFLLPSHKNATIYFAGHNAFGSFSNRYYLNIVALSNTSKPDADITSSQLEALINEIKNKNANYLFFEELKEPKVANTIKRELARENYSLELLLLHGYHNVSKEDFASRVTYAELFKNNIKNIKSAFGDK